MLLFRTDMRCPILLERVLFRLQARYLSRERFSRVHDARLSNEFDLDLNARNSLLRKCLLQLSIMVHGRLLF